MARNTKIINFSASPQLALEIKQWAKKENKSQSEVLRDAFKTYMFNEKLRRLQDIGEKIAEKLGLESYDDIEKFAG